MSVSTNFIVHAAELLGVVLAFPMAFGVHAAYKIGRPMYDLRRQSSQPEAMANGACPLGQYTPIDFLTRARKCNYAGH
jgi:hypothetical protein